MKILRKFIALPRLSRSVTQGLAASSSGHKRQQLGQSESTSEKTEALKLIGLEETPTLSTLSKTRDRFRRLEYVGAYVVDTVSRRKSEQAQEMFDKDYLIIPDVQLALPETNVAQRFLRRPSRERYWPEISGIEAAHKEGITGQDVLVGILDTGCDADHIELRDKRIDFRYVPLDLGDPRAVRGFDVAGHGTHVTGIVGGKNIGVAPGAELLVASVIESETHKTSLERIVIALNWMLSHFGRDENLTKPLIINMSLGFLPQWVNTGQIEPVINGIRNIVRVLVEDFDVLPIVAIGNDGPGQMRAPGYFPETLSVGAVDDNLLPADFSGGGTSPINGELEPNIVGYGVSVLSSLERDVERRSIYANLDGTSMATPYVAGIAALLASRDPSLQGMDLRQKLIDDALAIDAPANRVGAGLARFLL